MGHGFGGLLDLREKVFFLQGLSYLPTDRVFLKGYILRKYFHNKSGNVNLVKCIYIYKNIILMVTVKNIDLEQT
jgi:hypothetical protein